MFDFFILFFLLGSGFWTCVAKGTGSMAILNSGVTVSLASFDVVVPMTIDLGCILYSSDEFVLFLGSFFDPMKILIIE